MTKFILGQMEFEWMQTCRVHKRFQYWTNFTFIRRNNISNNITAILIN